MTRRGTRAVRRTGSNAPRIATRRSSPGRRACGAVATARLRRAEGRADPVGCPTAPASARAWSYPRSASRRRASGTHVTASAAGGSTATMASASAAATLRHPENFSRWIAARAGPAYRNGERASPTGGRRAVPAPIDRDGPGRPHRSHHGGAERFERGAAPVAERPGAVAAPRASRREHDVERPAEHDTTLAGDHRHRPAPRWRVYGRSSSIGAGRPRTSIRQPRLRPHDRVRRDAGPSALRRRTRVSKIVSDDPSALRRTGNDSGGVVV